MKKAMLILIAGLLVVSLAGICEAGFYDFWVNAQVVKENERRNNADTARHVKQIKEMQKAVEREKRNPNRVGATQYGSSFSPDEPGQDRGGRQAENNKPYTKHEITGNSMTLIR